MVESVAESLNIKVVPIVMRGTLEDGVSFVKSHPKSNFRDRTMEGIITKPLIELKDNQGKRIVAKIKAKDFPKPFPTLEWYLLTPYTTLFSCSKFTSLFCHFR